MNPFPFVLAALFVSGLAPACAQSADNGVTRPAFWGAPSVDGGKCCASLH